MDHNKTIFKPKPARMREHVECGIQLFPCHRPRKMGRDKKGEVVSLAKRPIINEWQKYKEPSAKVVKEFGSTNNIAAQLSDSWLVIDSDPRNQSETGMARLIDDCELDGYDFNPAEFYRVSTPGGGEHVYMKLPRNLKIAKKIRNYPGVDFLTKGSYVLIPGDAAAGKYYRKIEGSPALADTPEADEALLHLIEKREVATSISNQAGQWTTKQLAHVLEGIDAERFAGAGSYADWIHILMAAHFQTSGEGLQEAIDFSARVAEFADTAEDEVTDKWKSFSLNKKSKVGAGTLWHFIEASGNEPHDHFPAGTIDPNDDFTDDLESLDGPQSYTDEDDLPAKFTYIKDVKGKSSGKVMPSRPNLRLALHKMGVELSYDLFARRAVVEGMRNFGPFLGDHEADELRFRMENKFRLKGPEKTFFKIGMTTIARRNSFHPVHDYLNALQWDGVNRIDCWLKTYGGAADTEFNRAVGAIVLMAAVRRVRQPGVKFDELLTLESDEGQNKSSALRMLAVKGEWFSDSIPLDADDKHMIEATDGKWIGEIPELQAMRKNDWDKVKSNLSRATDRARMAYGYFADDRPRQFICIGTTNSQEYLFSPYGNRRFWPVKVKRFNLDELQRDRDQLWAEAAAREAAGASIRLPEALWNAAKDEQDKRQVADPFFEVLTEKLDRLEGTIKTEDVWRLLGVPIERRNQNGAGARMAAVMRKLGWDKPNKRGQLRFRGQQLACYIKGGKHEARGDVLTLAKSGDGYHVLKADTVEEGDDL